MLLLFFLKLIRSFLNNFIIKPVGVTTKKNTKPITIGEIKFPNSKPNLNQSLFKGLKILELINPSTKNIKDTSNDQILTSLPFKRGNKEIIKKTIKKTIPKLRLDPIFILFSFNF